jgi:beta-galactosidase/beta-glucuronidase
MERGEWHSLDGQWNFAFDDQRCGLREQWYKGHDYTCTINVPFVYQCKASGIGDTSVHDWVWYERTEHIGFLSPDTILRLHVGACDYESDVWINGQYCGQHSGGESPFYFDIEQSSDDDEDVTITILARDHSCDTTLPRGKQTFTGKSEGIFYTNSTGIWQSVWFERINVTHIDNVRFTPDIENSQIGMQLTVSESKGAAVRTRISRNDELLVDDTALLTGIDTYNVAYNIPDFNDHHYGHWWSTEQPNLYDVTFSLIFNNTVVDEVKSYFGMRSFDVEKGKICLNHMPFTTKSVLYQGYYPDSLMTAKNDAELQSDVQMIKDMGFNSVRLHQKFENPRFLYWCDRLGLIVWGEAPNAFSYSRKGSERLVHEWLDILNRDYSHPCIGVWVPVNESWGVPGMKNSIRQQRFSEAMYALTKSIDPTRIVMSNDGWEHTTSDLCTIHDYEADSSVLRERYSDIAKVLPGPQGRLIYVGGHNYDGEPVLLSEFGGIAFDSDAYGNHAWGYSGADNAEEFAKRVINIIRTVRKLSLLQGYCYTQFNDTEQEVNGLVTMQRMPKVDIKKIAEANG